MRRLLPILLVLLFGACDSGSTGPAIPNFEGTYTYAGTVNGEPASSLAGTLSITNQSGLTATIVSNIAYRNSGVVLLTFSTVTPSQAILEADGSISFDFSGTTVVNGQNVAWTLQHDGTLSGQSIAGTWSLTSSLGTDAGNFSAQR
jgi:hypothetical protein